MPINTGAIAKALKPVVTNWFGLDYAELPEEWSQVFEKAISMDAFEEDVNIHGFRRAAVKPEGTPLGYDAAKQAFIKRYVNLTYALGYVLTREAMEDNKYPKLLRQWTQALALSMSQTKEAVCALVIDRAADTNYVGGDGLCLSNAAHKLSKGGTFSNQLAVAADLSEASIEQALIDIGGFVNDAGHRGMYMGMTLNIPRQLEYDACRILDGNERTGTSDRDINAMKYKGKLPGGIVLNHYYADANAWFIKTNVKNGFKLYQRRPLEMENDTSDFDSENMKFKASERYSVGWTDPRCGFFSAGSS